MSSDPLHAPFVDDLTYLTVPTRGFKGLPERISDAGNKIDPSSHLTFVRQQGLPLIKVCKLVIHCGTLCLGPEPLSERRMPKF